MVWDGLGGNLLVYFEANREGLPRLNEVQTEVHLCKKPYSNRNRLQKGRILVNSNNKEQSTILDVNGLVVYGIA